MFSTKIGSFDGDSWERLMQTCLRMKYESEHYQYIPASPGDYGLEGFTKTGKVFQCYCPDDDLTFEELYDNQRDKITRDLRKLQTYEAQLKDYIKDDLIREWILVTPVYKKKDLIKHCNTKAEELRKLNLSIVHPECVVLVHDIDNFIREIPMALNGNGQKLHIMAEAEATSLENVTAWRDKSIDLVDNIIRKHTKRFNPDAGNIDGKVNDLTSITIMQYLEGEAILRKWQQMHPENYDRFLILASQIEADVKEKCMFPAANNNILYNEIKVLVETKLKGQFRFLDDMMITVLTNRTVAYWLLRCPLDFE